MKKMANSNKKWVQNTIIMLQRRGYSKVEFDQEPDEKKDRFTKDGVKIDVKKDHIIATKNRLVTNVFFVENTKVTVDVIKLTIATTIDRKDKKGFGLNHVIIVHSRPLTPDARSMVQMTEHTMKSPEEMKDDVFRFETFTFHEMSFDPIAIVPPHRLATEKVPFKNKLPVILHTDPIARYYCFPRGSIVEIEENGVISYRRCV
jgi:hypothetical protein